jgi:hypothetical protein
MLNFPGSGSLTGHFSSTPNIGHDTIFPNVTIIAARILGLPLNVAKYSTSSYFILIYLLFTQVSVVFQSGTV